MRVAKVTPLSGLGIGCLVLNEEGKTVSLSHWFYLGGGLWPLLGLCCYVGGVYVEKVTAVLIFQEWVKEFRGYL